MSRTAVGLSILLAGSFAFLFAQRAATQRLATQIQGVERELASERAANAQLREQIAQTDQEREKLRKDAAEVHRLRGEISGLRAANKALGQQVAKEVLSGSPVEAAAAPQAVFNPPTFNNYQEMGRFVAGLRGKAFNGGQLSDAEKQYLQDLRPQLEKLEHSPAEFASFQTELIQAAAGISDPAKTEQIRTTIQKVYENALIRGLDIPSRPADDLSWVDERFRLDRRGTQAVEKVLTEEERAAFGRQFIGIMGVDLGLGPDKSVYPRGFLGEAK